jgi:hypothetical protein
MLLPEKYGEAFSTLNVVLNRQADFDKFEDACEAMYHTMAKIYDISDSKLNLAGFNKKNKKNKWKGKRIMARNKISKMCTVMTTAKEVRVMMMMEKVVLTVEGQAMILIRAGCWRKRLVWSWKVFGKGKKKNQNGHCNSEVGAVGWSGRGSGVE